MRKGNRDILKLLTPEAQAAGIILGDISIGGKHASIHCTRADGSEFRFTLPITASCNRAMKNIVRDFRSMREKKDYKGP